MSVLSSLLHSRRRLRWPLLGLFAGAALLGLQRSQLDDRLAFWLQQQWRSTPVADSGLDLSGYRVSIDARPLQGVSHNLSGLAYDGDRGQLWAVLNNPEELLLLDRNGEVLQRHALADFQDVEDVAYLGDDLLVLLEERRHALQIIKVPQPGETLQRRAARSFTLSIEGGDNQGLEGLAYDRAGDRLFVVKEEAPRRVYELRGLKRSLAGDLALQLIDRSDEWVPALPARDLSAASFDPRSGSLLLLSDRSRLVLSLDRQGAPLSLLPLDAGDAGLDDDVPQAEGLAVDAQGNLYVASEPNLFYVLRPDSAAANQPDADEDRDQARHLAQRDGRLTKTHPAVMVQ